MNTQEHIALIKRHIKGLLAIAEKRTPGGWLKSQPAVDGILQAHFIVSSPTDVPYAPAAKCQSRTMNTTEAESNATFIASAAGNFESALRSTLAAIEALESLAERQCDEWCRGSLPETAEDGIAAILAEWPIERITGGQKA